MRKPKNSEALMIYMDKEIIVIESDSETDEVGCRMLAICGPENESYNETKKAGMEIVCADDVTGNDLVYDLDYQKYLASFCDNENLYLLEVNAREDSPLRLMYNVDNNKRRVTRNAVSGVSKRLKKTENGRAVHKRRVTRNADSRYRKTTLRKTRKIHVTKNKVDSKSKSHVKEESVNKFKACKKENEKCLSLIDKSYECYIEFLRNSLTIYQPEQKMKPVKDLVALNDPDIIAISNHPFPDGGNFPFEANKDGKIIDVEDGIVSDDLFESLFCKNLIEILRMPYDKMEFLELRYSASLKRPMTQNRELRDGRDMTYTVPNKLTPSFLEQYPDFKKMFRRYEKDCPRALNLLRGFFFYLKNIVNGGAFKPWEHEKRLMNMIK